MTRHLLFGFHAVGVRLKTAPRSVVEVHVDAGRRDQRMRQLVARAEAAEVRLVDSDDKRLRGLAGNDRHQGVVAIVEAVARSHSLDETLEAAEASGEPALVLVLDGVTDPHNLGACLRSAEAAGATAVVAPKDKAVGITPTVRRASAGAADRVAFFAVTNLARTLKQLKDKGVWLVGLAGDGKQDFYALDLKGAIAIVMGSEGEGMRRLTREACDFDARIPMRGETESLNVSVATGVALFEALRQRATPRP